MNHFLVFFTAVTSDGKVIFANELKSVEGAYIDKHKFYDDMVLKHGYHSISIIGVNRLTEDELNAWMGVKPTTSNKFFLVFYKGIRKATKLPVTGNVCAVTADPFINRDEVENKLKAGGLETVVITNIREMTYQEMDSWAKGS